MESTSQNLSLSGSPLSADHWVTLKLVHRTLEEEIAAGRYTPALGARNLLAKFTGVSTGTARTVIQLYSNDKDKEKTSALGRPKKTFSQEHYRVIRDFVGTRNANAEPTFAKHVYEHLQGTEYAANSIRTIQRDLRAMKFKYGVGNKLNILHDSPANIEYRKKYLQGRLSNLNANGLPINTEVFLDESYVHLDHHSKKTWFEPGTAMRERGRKPMLVIFGVPPGQPNDF